MLAIDADPDPHDRGVDAARPRRRAAARQRPHAASQDACGFDPLQTVERISIGLRARRRDRVAGVVVVRGVGAGTIACVARASARWRGRPTTRHVSWSSQATGSSSAWTTVGSTLIVQIDKQVSHDSLQAVLASGSPLRTSHAFMELYGRLAHGASVWGFIDGKTKLLDEIDGTGMRPQLLEGTRHAVDHVVMAGTATFQSADAAAKVDAQLKQVLWAPASSPSMPNRASPTARVTVSLSITGAQLSTLLAFF